MMSINTSCVFEICIQGLLPDRWSDWFDDLTIYHSSDDETILKGSLPDQAALLGVLTKIHSLNLKIVAVFSVFPNTGPGTSQRNESL